MPDHKWLLLVLSAALAPIGMAGCGGTDKSSGTRRTAEAATPAPTNEPADPQGAARLKVRRSRLGPIVVDARGRTLYFFTQDDPRKAVCTADYLNCTTSWPPLTTTGRPRGAAGVKTRLLGSFHRTKPAGSQVTYNRHPLYLYVEDKKPGDIAGQGLYGYWFVLAPNGRPITKN